MLWSLLLVELCQRCCHLVNRCFLIEDAAAGNDVIMNKHVKHGMSSVTKKKLQVNTKL